jgi:protein TonB
MRIAIAYFLSGLVHVGALSWISGVGDRGPIALPITRGRASVQLISSAAAAPQPAPEEELEWLRDTLNPEPKKTEAKARPELEPSKFEVSKREHEIIAAEASTEAFEPPPAPQPIEPKQKLLEDELAEPPRRRRPTLKSENDPASVADAASTASIGSEAFNGAEFDDLPRQAAANAPPPYPHDAYRDGRQGLVRLRVTISTAGTVSAISVDSSSGVPSLDDSALSTVRSWRFQPALRRGVPVSMDAIVPIRFSIRSGVKAEKP